MRKYSWALAVMMRALLLSSATIDTPVLRSSRGAAASGGRPAIEGAVGWPTSGPGPGTVTGTAGTPAALGTAVAAGMPGAPGRNAGWPETASGNGPVDTVAVVVRVRLATRPCSWLP